MATKRINHRVVVHRGPGHGGTEESRCSELAYALKRLLAEHYGWEGTDVYHEYDEVPEEGGEKEGEA